MSRSLDFFIYLKKNPVSMALHVYLQVCVGVEGVLVCLFVVWGEHISLFCGLAVIVCSSRTGGFRATGSQLNMNHMTIGDKFGFVGIWWHIQVGVQPWNKGHFHP
jgi:hypothetical protein